jgi:hypothetical protein
VKIHEEFRARHPELDQGHPGCWRDGGKRE